MNCVSSVSFFIFFLLYCFFFLLLYFFFFFFQAEDGIRDWSVTGVQTCALPISARASDPTIRCRRAGRVRSGARARRGWRATSPPGPARTSPGGGARGRSATRSEERRVGKECRSRWGGEARTKMRGESGQMCGCE